MKPDGGLSFTPNKVGAQYGSGYCDAQCPTDISYIGGQANSNANWGSCCPEFDVWEANKYATAYTAHPCKSSTPIRCTVGVNCAGQCDQSGCDFNPYRQGNKTFYGPGSSYTIDTTQPFTVVTQFYTNNNQDTGNLTNIVRYYIQNGKKILNSNTSVSGLPNYSSINDTNCNSQFTTYGDTNVFKAVGGMTGMGKAMANGMVLVLSLWDDYSANMLWLDSNYPTSANPSNPGVSRGPCGTGTGSPGNV
jgi:cellulose 1,4-beta-cellobiosidase